MKLEAIKSPGLAHNSYFLSDANEALVVDPRRDGQIYNKLAQRECVKLKYILETHRNEDFAIGSLQLQNTTDAQICHSKELPFKYGENNLSDGETLRLGSLRIQVLYTPGHTNDSISFAIYQPENSSNPVFVFTGDTLFAGSVGRTDLYGAANQQAQAEKLYASLNEKLLPLGDHVLVYPAHGAGSLCGNEIADEEYSTIGYEKKRNPFLNLNKEDFVKEALREEMLVPPYFKKMEELNLNGPPILRSQETPPSLGIEEFKTEMNQSGTIVIDTRMPYAFAGSFIPNSLSIWLGGSAVYPGWLIDYDQRILFVHERKEDMRRIARYFWRLGYDKMIGYLCNGINEWQEDGAPVDSLLTLSVHALKTKLAENEVHLVDVREPHEWKADGFIEGAQRIFFGHLQKEAENIPRDKPIAVICSTGKRSSIGASILKKKKFTEISNVLGGMTAWTKMGYPTRKD